MGGEGGGAGLILFSNLTNLNTHFLLLLFCHQNLVFISVSQKITAISSIHYSNMHI